MPYALAEWGKILDPEKPAGSKSKTSSKAGYGYAIA